MTLADILKFEHTNYTRKHRRLRMRQLRRGDIYSYLSRKNVNELFTDSVFIDELSHKRKSNMQLEQVFLLLALVSIIASGVYLVLA